MIKYLILMTYFCFSLISSLNANQSDYMTYEDFLFDVQDLLDRNVKVEVPVAAVDIPSRTLNVDFSNLDISLKNIDRSTIKDIVALCEFSTTCFIDVEEILKDNPELFPPYIIEASAIKLWFLIGVAVSESGYTYINIDENSAVTSLLDQVGDEAYVSGEVWVNETGSLVVGFGSGVTDFYASWVFNKDVNLATNEALQLCNDHITGILNLTVECEAITFDVPWW